MNDYRLTIKVRNNRILKAIEESGGMPGEKWCKANGICYASLNSLINMTTSPLRSTGNLSQCAAKLCDVLGKHPDDLWSNDQLYPLERNFSEMEMSHEHVVALLPKDKQQYLPDFSEIENQQVALLVNAAIATLTRRERDVIRMRFYDDLTLDECGERLGVTRECIRQIEWKAMRKLRHPSRVGMFVDAIDSFGLNVTCAHSRTNRDSLKNAAKEYLKEHASA